METKNIDFSTKPKGYKLCFSDKCLLAEKCLRRIAVSKLAEDDDFLQVVNHAKFDEKNCKLFADSDNVNIAYGMKSAFGNLLVNDADKIRIELIQHFGQTEFYRRKNGLKAISPEEQEYIINVFSKFGYSISFDKVIESTFWRI